MEFLEMTNDEYHAEREHVGKSWLDHISKSPAHLRWYLDQEPAPKTPALIQGSLVHSLVLEDDISDYAVMPKFDRRTKAGKQGAEDWEQDNAGLIPVTEDQHRIALAIRDAVYRNEAARMLLKSGSGEPEKTVFTVDAGTGVKCKARADWWRPDLNWIVDLKTTEDASIAAFKRSIVKYRYHVQAAHYLECFAAENFVFIAFEKSPPYGVAVYDASMIAELGWQYRRENLELYRHCAEIDSWPGYSDEIQQIELPSWA